MYPSGSWAGFWQQEGWGRQPMQAFELSFNNGRVTGGGRDVIGRFSFVGEYDPANGQIRLIKKYVNAHRVDYIGKPDGEGCILGTWKVETSYGSTTWPFLMKPNVSRPVVDDSIQEIVPTH